MFLLAANTFNLDMSKVLLFGKPLKVESLNPFPNKKNLDWSKLKAPADNKINITLKLKFVSSRVENIVGKGDNAGYQHCLLFPQCFQKASVSGS